MADRGSKSGPEIQLDYEFDRRHPAKLEQAYRILTPQLARTTSERTMKQGGNDAEDRSHLRSRVVG